MFNLRPTIPQIINGGFIGSWSTEYCDYICNDLNDKIQLGKLNIDVETKQATHLILTCWNYVYFYSDFPINNLVFGTTMEQHMLNRELSSHTIQCWFTWGYIFQLSSYNEFGSTYSKKYFSTDFIIDPNILKEIDEFDKITSDNIETHIDNLVNISPNKIIINSDTKFFSTIISMQGITMLSGYKDNEIDISALRPGIYILSLRDSNNNLQTIKFLKQ